MPDLFEPLRSTTPVAPPPAETVRRRGDQIRRRRSGLQATAAAVVVALVGVGGYAVSGGDPSASPEPGYATNDPSPTASSPTTGPTDRPAQGASSLLQTIPRDFPLDQGLEVQPYEGPKAVISALGGFVQCRAHHSPADVTVDHLGLVTAPRLGESIGRDLDLYEDEAMAHERATMFIGWLEDCPRFTLDGGASYAVTTVQHVDPRVLGAEGWSVVRTYESGGEPQLGQEILVVARVGNAVLTTWHGVEEGSGATDSRALEADVRDERAVAQPLVDAMAVFARHADHSYADVLDHHGLGPLDLGLDRAALHDTGVVTIGADLGRCRVVDLDVPAPDTWQEDALLSPRVGVAVVFGREGIVTTEGIGMGSTRADVESAYGTDVGTGGTALVPLPEGAVYRFGFEGDTVTTFDVELPDQDCLD